MVGVQSSCMAICALVKNRRYVPVLVLLDVCSIISLALYALWVEIFAVFVNVAYGVPIFVMLIHIVAVGAGMYLLCLHGRVGRIIAGGLLLLVWFLQILVITAIVPFDNVVVVGLHILTFLYPIVLFVGIVQERFGSRLFHLLALAHILIGFVYFVVLFMVSGFSVSQIHFDIALLLVFVFGVLYPAFRLYCQTRSAV